MGHQLNGREATRVLKILRSEKPNPAMDKALTVRRPAREAPCRIGAHGVCLTHGQVSTDCEKDE